MAHHFQNLTGQRITRSATIALRHNAQWVYKDFFSDILADKKIIIFGLPGAFTPTCSSSHLPRYEQLFDSFTANGIDEIWCLSVNDTFVMNAWAQHQGVSKVKMLPDGNATIVRLLGMDVLKEDLGFGPRAWRFSMMLDDATVKHHFIEDPSSSALDPFALSDADTMLKALNPLAIKPADILLFTKTDCPFCLEIKQRLAQADIPFTELPLADNLRNAALRSLLGSGHEHTVPLAFINGNLCHGVTQIRSTLAI